jgi:hypothetical protein
MKKEIKDQNYCCTVVKIKSLRNLANLDNLMAVDMYGFTGLVTKDYEVGQLCLMFTSESQLSEDFCFNNNLFRHKELNKDKEKSSYLEDSRRIRCIKIRGNVSSALFMPISSLSYLGEVDLKEGDCFNSIDGVEVCRKYIIKQHNHLMGSKSPSNRTLRKSRIDAKLMPEHYSTSHWLRNHHLVDDETEVVLTVKKHGTSVRLSNQLCDRKLSKWEKWLKWFGFKIQEQEYDYFAGSRRVIKDLARKNLVHYYDLDVWNQALERYKHVIPKNFCLYGEIIGHVGDSPIQKNYTYQIPKGEWRLYIYRISFINPDGFAVDLSWDQVKEFCNKSGLNHVVELERGKKKNIDTHKYMDKRFREDLGLLQCLPLDGPDLVDEGCVIMVNGISQTYYKHKSPRFLLAETKVLDSGEENIEDSQ